MSSVSSSSDATAAQGVCAEFVTADTARSDAGEVTGMDELSALADAKGRGDTLTVPLCLGERRPPAGSATVRKWNKKNTNSQLLFCFLQAESTLQTHSYQADGGQEFVNIKLLGI